MTEQTRLVSMEICQKASCTTSSHPYHQRRGSINPSTPNKLTRSLATPKEDQIIQVTRTSKITFDSIFSGTTTFSRLIRRNTMYSCKTNISIVAPSLPSGMNLRSKCKNTTQRHGYQSLELPPCCNICITALGSASLLPLL